MADRVLLFQKKLRQCSVVFTFADPREDSQSRDVKKQTLVEVVEYINTAKAPFPEAVYPDVIKMVSSNLCRAVPPKKCKDPEGFDPEEDDPVLDPCWPHLQVVYEFLLRFVESPHTDVNIAKKYFDTSFIGQILELFNSDDPRERDYLKTTLHRIYGKFLSHRAFIRKAINNLFYKFIYEEDMQNGVAELLEILGSIINGFALPLKDEHKQFLAKALIPLHKPRAYTMYHQQLTYCMTQFLEKDPRLSETIVNGLLKLWPVTHSPKELLFLAELEELLELTDAKDFCKFVEPLFRRLSKCISSSNFQVAERALFLWNNEYIAGLIEDNRQVILPIIFGSLFKNSKSHWNTSIHNLTYNVLKIFNEMDAQLFDECSATYKADQARLRVHEVERKKQWHQLESLAKRNVAEGIVHIAASEVAQALSPSAEEEPETPEETSEEVPKTEEEREANEDLDQLLKKVR
eukprot:TRINITY_DN1359_c0_g6_i1.p1 TRINITY_DN1359_c0_g6~~TRINITY_DN1359_c0_g6_i1.p1  ORF type:complete len:462 (+),score=87.31 TRINITY_DN1359_c0_g6_i1:460-1845(+)